jgi:hypothetical protein
MELQIRMFCFTELRLIYLHLRTCPDEAIFDLQHSAARKKSRRRSTHSIYLQQHRVA